MLTLGINISCVLFAAISALATGAQCPDGWVQRGASCYLVNTSRTMSWAGAGALCQEHGATLLNISDRAKLLEVNQLLAVNSVSEWWINIRRTSESTALAQVTFDNFADEKAGTAGHNSYQCAYMSSFDTFWYWSRCDATLHFVCEKPVEHVQIQLVSPDVSHPSAAWLAAHARNIEDYVYTRRVNAGLTDDKGTFVAAKATMTARPVTQAVTVTMPTRPLEITAPTAAPTAPTTTSTTVTPNLCQGSRWMMLDSTCYQLVLDAKDQSSARAACQQLGGELALLGAPAIRQRFVSRFSHNSGSVWLGRGAPPGSSAEVRFGHNQTNCTALQLHTGQLFVANCAGYKPFVCERALTATARPSTVAPPTTPVPVSRCEAGWLQYHHLCYLLVTDPPPVTWHEAHQACRRLSAQMAKLSNPRELFNVFHMATRSNLHVWIGLTKLDPPHDYKWDDGTPVPMFLLEPLSHADPMVDMVSCIRMSNERPLWTRVNCNSPQYYICQRPLDGGTVAPPPVRLPPLPPGLVSCPDGWTLFGADRCLQVSDRLASWAEARRTCRRNGPDADLATIDGPVRQAFVTSAVKDSQVNLWIGLTYIKLEHQFVTWVDESMVNYTNWAPGQPSNVCDECPNACGLVGGRRSYSPAQWSDVDCSLTFKFICQRPAKAVAADQSPAVRAHCQPPYSEYLAVGDMCLKVVQQPVAWQQAADTCRLDNASLAYVADKFDNAELVKLLYRHDGNQYWLGLSDVQNYGHMQWMSPWPAEALFLAWQPAAPGSGQRASCGALRPSSGLWRHAACSDQLPFVCMHAPSRERARQSARRCPSGLWSASDTRCYRLQDSQRHAKTWREARQACEEQNQKLAVVSSENDFLAVMEAVQGLTVNNAAWIGLRRTEQGYQWVDGTAVVFAGWADGEPTASREACVEASRVNSGRWNDVRCGMYRPFVCMVDINENGTALTAAITAPHRSGDGTSGWTVFGVVCLAVLLLVTLAAGAVWMVRRHRLQTRHRRMDRSSSSHHHSMENVAYRQGSDTLCSSHSEGNKDNLDAGASVLLVSSDDRQQYSL